MGTLDGLKWEFLNTLKVDWIAERSDPIPFLGGLPICIYFGRFFFQKLTLTEQVDRNLPVSFVSPLTRTFLESFVRPVEILIPRN